MPDLSTEQRNVAVVRGYFEVVWNGRRPDRIGEFAHPDGVAYQTCGVLVGREKVREVLVERMLEAFPDLRVDVEAVLAVGDQAVVRWRLSATHLGEGLGMRPTGTRVGLVGMTWLVLRDGKISRGWDCWDHGGLLERCWRAARERGDSDTGGER
ncbi:MAG TPA: ester cyclase [Planctomycetaceae bacterium]